MSRTSVAGSLRQISSDQVEEKAKSKSASPCKLTIVLYFGYMFRRLPKCRRYHKYRRTPRPNPDRKGSPGLPGQTLKNRATPPQKNLPGRNIRDFDLRALGALNWIFGPKRPNFAEN